MITHRFASAADIDAYYGERPRRTLQAIAVLMDEKPVAILGLENRRDRYIAFSEYKPDLAPHLKSIAVLRAVKAAQRMILNAPMPVLVVNTANPKLLERLGFIEREPGVHLCLNSLQ